MTYLITWQVAGMILTTLVVAADAMRAAHTAELPAPGAMILSIVRA